MLPAWNELKIHLDRDRSASHAEYFQQCGDGTAFGHFVSFVVNENLHISWQRSAHLLGAKILNMRSRMNFAGVLKSGGKPPHSKFYSPLPAAAAPPLRKRPTSSSVNCPRSDWPAFQMELDQGIA